eukprot:1682739-Amphidinium_carterae.2
MGRTCKGATIGSPFDIAAIIPFCRGVGSLPMRSDTLNTLASMACAASGRRFSSAGRHQSSDVRWKVERALHASCQESFGNFGDGFSSTNAGPFTTEQVRLLLRADDVSLGASHYLDRARGSDNQLPSERVHSATLGYLSFPPDPALSGGKRSLLRNSGGSLSDEWSEFISIVCAGEIQGTTSTHRSAKQS